MFRALGAFATMVALLITGCASTPPGARDNQRATPPATLCAQFDAARKRAQYQTQYVRAATDSERMLREQRPLPAGALALAPVYRLRLSPADAHPCTHLTVHKELHFLRGAASLNLEEVREIFTADGTRIAVRTEDVSAQLRASGSYRATLSLPLPEKTPPGRYHMITRLVLRTPGGGSVVLADTSAGFTVHVRPAGFSR